MPEVRHEIVLDVLAVGTRGRGPQPRSKLVVEPVPQVGSDRHPIVVAVLARLDLGEHLGQGSGRSAWVRKPPRLSCRRVPPDPVLSSATKYQLPCLVEHALRRPWAS